MERSAIKKLQEWKESPYRKPLLVQGARQVGKTWLLKEFGKRFYKNTAYFNFDENPQLKEFFQTTKNPQRIISNLALASGGPIHEKETLIIFDEIQDCPEVLNSLKYFYETAPAYHVTAAGSLLGVALSHPSSFPVGMVSFLTINPMTFNEFLMANDETLVDYLQSLDSLEKIPDIFFSQLQDKLKTFFITGGMPEPVRLWTERHDVDLVQAALSDIISAYERDFAKHPHPKDFPKLSFIWNSLPSQLARENKKFLYQTVKPGARAREYEDALHWLVDARVARKVFRTKNPSLPLSAYDDLSAFKIYLSDVGILRRLALLAPTAFAEGNRLFVEFKGALTENYILQSLENIYETPLRYWTSRDRKYEVDFILQRNNDIIPIEVKSDVNVTSRSLKAYRQEYPEATRICVRFSLQNIRKDADILNIPLFLADQTDKLVSLALKQS